MNGYIEILANRNGNTWNLITKKKKQLREINVSLSLPQQSKDASNARVNFGQRFHYAFVQKYVQLVAEGGSGIEGVITVKQIDQKKRIDVYLSKK